MGEEEDRDCRDAPISQWALRLTGKHQELEMRQGVQSPSGPPVGTSSADTSMSHVQPPELSETRFLLFQATQVVAICYGSPQETRSGFKCDCS